jgi:aspartate carbamoyltransferase regulatory subunit
MQINSISKGIVIDHIRGGHGMKVLGHLDVDPTRDTVALIINAVSEKHGRKDIIKIENLTEVDLDVLGLMEPAATVNVIQNGTISDKIKLKLPKKVVDVIHCKNPRCVTSQEQVPHTFRLADETGLYRCIYCDNLLRADET